jgi:hypothetical protein
LLKLLARHQQFQQQASAKEFLQHAFYFNHPPPNAVAAFSPRTHLSNGLSKLNTENSLANAKLSSSSTVTNGKFDSQQANASINTQTKKIPIPSTANKDASAFDQWLQPPLGSIIQGPPCLQADTSSSSSSSVAAGTKSETTLSSGSSFYIRMCSMIEREKRELIEKFFFINIGRASSNSCSSSR